MQGMQTRAGNAAKLSNQEQLLQQQQMIKARARMVNFASTTLEILRKYSKYPPSLKFHIHESHFRFNNTQDSSIIPKDSPMAKSFLQHIMREEIPTEMAELLKDFAIKFYDGCLILQVYDHRGTEKENEPKDDKGSGVKKSVSPKTYRTLLRPTAQLLYYDLLYHTDSTLNKFTDQLSLQMESEILALTDRKLDLSVKLNPYLLDTMYHPTADTPKKVWDEKSQDYKVQFLHRDESFPETRKLHEERQIMHKLSEYEELMFLLTNKYTNPADSNLDKKLVVVGPSHSSSSDPMSLEATPIASNAVAGSASNDGGKSVEPTPAIASTALVLAGNATSGQFMRLRFIEEIRKRKESQKAQTDAAVSLAQGLVTQDPSLALQQREQLKQQAQPMSGQMLQLQQNQLQLQQQQGIQQLQRQLLQQQLQPQQLQQQANIQQLQQQQQFQQQQPQQASQAQMLPQMSQQQQQQYQRQQLARQQMGRAQQMANNTSNMGQGYAGARMANGVQARQNMGQSVPQNLTQAQQQQLAKQNMLRAQQFQMQQRQQQQQPQISQAHAPVKRQKVVQGPNYASNMASQLPVGTPVMQNGSTRISTAHSSPQIPMGQVNGQIPNNMGNNVNNMGNNMGQNMNLNSMGMNQGVQSMSQGHMGQLSQHQQTSSQPQQQQQQQRPATQPSSLQQQQQQIFLMTLSPQEQQAFRQLQARMNALVQMGNTGVAPNRNRLTPQQQQQAMQQAKTIQQQLLQRFPTYFQRLRQFQMVQQQRRQAMQRQQDPNMMQNAGNMNMSSPVMGQQMMGSPMMQNMMPKKQ